MPILVVVIREPGPPFELVAAPTIDPAPIDIRAALELDEQLYDRARRWSS